MFLSHVGDKTNLYSFPVAALTSYDKLNGLNNTSVLVYSSVGQKSDMLYSAEIRMSARLHSSGDSQVEFVSLQFLVSRGCLHFGSWLPFIFKAWGVFLTFHGSDAHSSSASAFRLKCLNDYLGWLENPAEKGMATHSSIPPWRIPWTKEPGALQSLRLQRVRHNWVTNIFTSCVQV